MGVKFSIIFRGRSPVVPYPPFTGDIPQPHETHGWGPNLTFGRGPTMGPGRAWLQISLKKVIKNLHRLYDIRKSILFPVLQWVNIIRLFLRVVNFSFLNTKPKTFFITLILYRVFIGKLQKSFWTTETWKCLLLRTQSSTKIQ